MSKIKLDAEKLTIEQIRQKRAKKMMTEDKNEPQYLATLEA